MPGFGLRDDGMVTVSEGLVRIAAGASGDAAAVVAALNPDELAGMMVFCSNPADIEAVAAVTAKLPAVLPVIGCTTAGEITPWGQREGGVVAVGFPAHDFDMQALRFDGLLDFDPFAAHRHVAEMIGEARIASERLGTDVERAAVLLIDGLSCREELITHTLRHILEGVAMVGGSAGDGMAFRETWLLHGGVPRRDCAVLALLTSRHALRVLFTSHHDAGDRYAVVTRADTAARTVQELDGEPAAREYAAMVGLPVEELDTRVFARHPLMVRVGGDYYARAPMRVTEEGGLAFHSAIARGLVMRQGRLSTMIDSLQAGLDEASDGPIDAVIAFECVQNRVEADMAGLSGALAELYSRHRFVGFHGYGEQYRDLHLNRNLVGLAIGRRGT